MSKRAVLALIFGAVLVALIPVSIWLVIHFAIEAYVSSPSPPANTNNLDDLQIRVPLEEPSEADLRKEEVGFDPDLASETGEKK
jgi:hypothetical protein